MKFYENFTGDNYQKIINKLRSDNVLQSDNGSESAILTCSNINFFSLSHYETKLKFSMLHALIKG